MTQSVSVFTWSLYSYLKHSSKFDMFINMCDTDLCDLLSPREAVFLKVIGQVQEGAPLQVLAVTEDDQ